MRTSEAGYTFLALLFLLAVLSVSMAALGTLWQTHAQRGKEAELLFVGDQYRRALDSYHRMTPGTAKHYPPSLDLLLRDERFPNLVRHIRRLYPDPLTGNREWGLLRDAEGGIVGVHSLATATPMKTAGFAAHYEHFARAARYADWVFRASPAPPPAASTTP
jgi:type II secretory pathway pseudopilin PulG